MTRADVSESVEALSHSAFSSSFGVVAAGFGFTFAFVLFALDWPEVGLVLGFETAGVFAVVTVDPGFLPVVGFLAVGF